MCVWKLPGTIARFHNEWTKKRRRRRRNTASPPMKRNEKRKKSIRWRKQKSVPTFTLCSEVCSSPHDVRTPSKCAFALASYQIVSFTLSWFSRSIFRPIPLFYEMKTDFFQPLCIVLPQSRGKSLRKFSLFAFGWFHEFVFFLMLMIPEQENGMHVSMNNNRMIREMNADSLFFSCENNNNRIE